jgi:CBS domain containing-hemolysin-like protein
MIGRLRAWRDSVAVRVGPEALSAYLFRNFALPEWLLFAFLFGGLTPITTGLLQTVAANVLMVVTFLYMLQGLAIYRALLIAIGVGVGGTVLGWTLMVFALATGVGWLLLAIAGLFDPFFDFRHFKRKDDSHESHTD